MSDLVLETVDLVDAFLSMVLSHPRLPAVEQTVWPRPVQNFVLLPSELQGQANRSLLRQAPECSWHCPFHLRVCGDDWHPYRGRDILPCQYRGTRKP